MVFSTQEIKDITISVLVLGLVFSYPEFLFNPLFFIVSLFTVGIAFIGHELSHKFVARRKGYWAEYRMWNQGILLAILFALGTGGAMIFAAPGAVYFAARSVFSGTKKSDVGLIGIAGIVFNLALFAVLFPAYLVTGLGILRFAALINVWLALFNLLPFGPLDGAKVLKWDPRIWALAFGLSIVGFVLTLS